MSIGTNVSSYEDRLELFLIISIALFILLALIFFVLIILSRTKHQLSNLDHTTRLLLIEDVLNKILFDDKPFEIIAGQINLKSHLESKNFGTVLMSELLKLHGNLSGEHADKLKSLYIEGNLVSDSYKKLSSRYWQVKCKGVIELSQMGIYESLNKFHALYKKSKGILKNELGYAIVRLDGFNGLSFLLDNPKSIDDWQQLNIISILNKPNNSSPPDFSPYLFTQNTSLTIFAIRLVSHFNQGASLNAISKLLNHTSVKVRKLVIQTITRFQGAEYIETILNNYIHENEELRVEILKALTVLGNEKHVKFIFGRVETK